MIVRKAFRFRLKPKTKDHQQLVNFAGSCRYIYNWGLEQRKKTFESEGKGLSYYDQNVHLTKLKKELEWLKEPHSQILQQSLYDLDKAFQHFFRRIKQKETPGYPRYKAKGIRDAFRYPQGVKIEENKAYLPKIGWIKFRKTREIEGTLKQTTISRRGDHWYISFSCEIHQPDPIQAPLNPEKAVGIDLGLIYFGVLASGLDNQRQIINPPKYLKTQLPKLRKLSRALSRKKKGSQNWKKAKNKLARLHAKIRYSRENFAHQLSTKIVKSHDIICVENLQITLMLKEKKFSRSIADASWRSFLSYLKYKALNQGKHLVELGKYFPSSQQCSSCGHRQKIALSQREFECESCKLVLDRDYNSSIVIKAAGTSALLKACGVTSG